MTGYVVVGLVAGFVGWAYGRMRNQRAEDQLRLEACRLRNQIETIQRLERRRGESMTALESGHQEKSEDRAVNKGVDVNLQFNALDEKSLRVFFAGKAMQGTISACSSYPNPDTVAEFSFRMADAMMKAMHAPNSGVYHQ